MHYALVILIALVLGCGAGEPLLVQEVKTVSGHLRYQAANGTVTADLVMPDSTRQVPGMMGNTMEPLDGLPGRRFRYTAVRDLPELVRFTVNVQEEPTIFSFVTHGIYIDSLPDSLYRDRSVNFPVADRGLTERESLVIFFEPGDRSTPRRILVSGPTSSGVVSLPPQAVDDIAPGNYEVYFVKQRLFKDQIGTTKASIQTEYFTQSKDVVVQ
ncbi:hypothetical protein [Lewinella sp. IMCC34191]|uniref:hypothetical protein n=1 Tax=Lewinella sp. IMCC34191 TaxID=2259172 RepID=UPI000E2884E2|nr:hypothetical protein [Lewinella sp. IMCC34191]